MPENIVKHSALKVISINVESFSYVKRDIIAKICHDEAWHILCLQETHLEPHSVRPCIPGMKLAIESPHVQYGSAIFANSNITNESTSSSRVNNVELLITNLRGVTVTSIHKQPTMHFSPSKIVHNDSWVVIGDFNSHSTNWGYDVTDDDGDLIKSWADSNHLSLSMTWSSMLIQQWMMEERIQSRHQFRQPQYCFIDIEMRPRSHSPHPAPSNYIWS